MSRASSLRDELITAMQAELGANVHIEKCVIPNFTREEVSQHPGNRMLAVRFANREVDSINDIRTVTIEIAVVGILQYPDSGTPTEAEVRTAQIASADACDDLMEQVIELWVPQGTFFRVGFADHRFFMLSQVRGFDVKQLHDNGVWLSVVEVMFKDIEDE